MITQEQLNQLLEQKRGEQARLLADLNGLIGEVRLLESLVALVAEQPGQSQEE